MTTPLDTIFHTKYEEFATSLTDVFPELLDEIKAAIDLPKADRLTLYKSQVIPGAGKPGTKTMDCPGLVLPGVLITPALWTLATEGTKKAVYEYLSVLTFSLVMKEGDNDEFGGEAFKSWANSFMDQWRTKMDRTDFDSFAKRFADMFGSGGERLPPFPERLRKGKLAKLAEDIVKELNPEEFGLDPETIRQCEADPSKAFEILMGTTMKNPELLQGAMKRIIKRLQDKFKRGEFNPQDLAAEAEEMMKEFSENPAFVDMMESMRKTFGFEDMDTARASGHEHSARMSIVKERLRRKLEAKKQGRK